MTIGRVKKAILTTNLEGCQDMRIQWQVGNLS